MKMIQSLWTKPIFDRLKSRQGSDKFFGGWPQKKYYYYSLALSCLQLKKYYNEVELYTDELGHQLIDKMRLPYTRTIVELNTLDKYDIRLWALGKMYAYQKQDSPFLHVDSDVFIWNKFDDNLLKQDLIAQNKETKFGAVEILSQIHSEFLHVPDFVKNSVGLEYIPCSNAGILGGNNIEFLQQFANAAFQFINSNFDRLERIDLDLINHIYEQMFFYSLAEIDKVKIAYLFPDAPENPEEVGYFYAASKNQGYVHSFGFRKRSLAVYASLEDRLKTLYPEAYNHITELVLTSEI